MVMYCRKLSVTASYYYVAITTAAILGTNSAILKTCSVCILPKPIRK